MEAPTPLRKALALVFCDLAGTTRFEEISRASLPAALNPIPPEQFPLQNYVLCSEEVAGILSRRAPHWELASIGLLKLKGFPGWREAFRVLPEEDATDLAAATRLS